MTARSTGWMLILSWSYFSGVYGIAADMNQDGAVNGLDARPFSAAVVGGAASVVGVANVPEPATIMLLAFGALLLIRRRT